MLLKSILNVNLCSLFITIIITNLLIKTLDSDIRKYIYFKIMNISQSTYSNNSRFVSNHKDPLEKYKLGLKERFKQTYDQIEE